ncbi:MAG: DUF4837 family protein [Bacteroidales bacterium]|nr:DUF4837 family protein [Bacteroidales bacterium]
MAPVCSCASNNAGGNALSGKEDKVKYMSSVSGKAGDVLVVVGKDLWETEVGDALRDVMACEYPFLPQREPYFNLYNTPHNAFNGAFMVHRNVVVVNIGAKFPEARVICQKDLWAHPQVVVSIQAPSPAAAVELIRDNTSLIQQTIEQGERDRIITNSKKFQDQKIRNQIAKLAGGAPYFPKSFSIKRNVDDFIWVSHETTYVNQGLLVYTIPNPAVNRESLTKEFLLSECQEVLKNNVPGMRDGSYMTFSDMVEPEMEFINYQDRVFAQMRGLWELENDYMGGPFVIHAFPNALGDRLIVLHGFVYAPKYNKRSYLRNVESILYSFDWKK